NQKQFSVLSSQFSVLSSQFSVGEVMPLRSSMSAMEISRRSFVALSATLPFAIRAYAKSSIPIGLELYSVREALKQDPEGTVRAVAKLGYECVEFYGPYYAWTHDEAKSMRKLMDDLGIRCYSTHNDQSNFGKDKIAHARDLNLIL